MGYTTANGKRMEVLHDPHVPGGKRLVPTLEDIDSNSMVIRRRSKDMNGPVRRATIESRSTEKVPDGDVTVVGVPTRNSNPSTSQAQVLKRRNSDPAVKLDGKEGDKRDRVVKKSPSKDGTAKKSSKDRPSKERRESRRVEA
jgi:hypothetical protein